MARKNILILKRLMQGLLAVKWSRLCTSAAGGIGTSVGQELRSVSHTAKKYQNKIKIKRLMQSGYLFSPEKANALQI